MTVEPETPGVSSPGSWRTNEYLAIYLNDHRAGAAGGKPNGHILTYSPLSRVIEVEALMAGVQVKQRLWVTLRLLTPARPALNLFDFAALERRGAEQLDILAEVHEWAAEQLVRD
jgi:hypothetical protein